MTGHHNRSSFKRIADDINAYTSKHTRECDVNFIRALSRDLWHVSITRGKRTLTNYTKIQIFRKMFDTLRLMKFFMVYQFECKIRNSDSNELYFSHDKKYFSKIPHYQQQNIITCQKNRVGITLPLLNFLTYFNINDDFIFLSAILRYISKELSVVKDYEILNIFEGDAALTSLLTCLCRQHNLKVRLIQWGHVPPSKGLIVFADIGVDEIICDNPIIAKKLTNLNKNTLITITQPEKTIRPKILFIDQGVNSIVNQTQESNFLNLAVQLSLDGYHVDIKIHPNNQIKLSQHYLDKVGIISGGNRAEDYFDAYTTVVGVFSSALVYAADAGLKTISFNPHLFDNDMFSGYSIIEVKDYAELRAAL
jgi:hypothetical protein